MLTNRSMPEQILIPVLGYPDVGAAIEWLCGAFGFTERWRVGDHRAQLAVGQGAAIAVTEGETPAHPTRDHVMVRVDDVDEHLRVAHAHGADVLSEPRDMAYGERQYSVRDFTGRVWVFSQSVADRAPEDWGGVSAADRVD